MPSQADWPEWWHWELDCSNPHLAKRMVDRSFNETDLRQMLEAAKSCQADRTAGRWKIETLHDRADWLVIVEPEDVLRKLVVVTAFPKGS